jgi:hypothetical protein
MMYDTEGNIPRGAAKEVAKRLVMRMVMGFIVEDEQIDEDDLVCSFIAWDWLEVIDMDQGL